MDDLLREFLTETNESLDVVDVELVKFEQDPNNAKILDNIFRLVHTIKGTCGFLGLPRLEAIAHAAETLMGKFRDGAPVTSEAVSLVLASIDRIKSILGELERLETEPEGEDRDIIAELERMAMAAGTEAVAPAPPQPTVGTLVPQVLERALRPGEVALDELERAFRETKVEAKAEASVTVGTLVAQTLERPLRPGEVALDELERAFRETAVDKQAAPKPTEKADKAKPAAAKADNGANDDENSVKNQSIRVNVDTLEQLMTMVSELVLTRNQLLEIARRNEDNEFKVPLQRLSNVTAELQEGVMKTRMQPIGNAWQKLPRIIRDLARDLGKSIELDLHGADTELDRQVLELIKDPLTHMVRNSADHGLETPAERKAKGKPETGIIKLAAFHQGGHIIIEIADDGRGLDVAAIRRKAIANGIVSDAEADKLSEAQIHKFIFAPGFSTAAKVTNVSGRGVGMDVVKTNIDQIGGTVDLKSTPGKGTTFTIKIPLTLAIVSALIVEAGGERFAIPQLAVVELVRASTDGEHRIERIKDTPVLRLRNKLLPLVRLKTLLGLDDKTVNADDQGFVVVTQIGSRTFGIVVDGVFHTEEIVVKPMSSKLRHIAMFSGNTILGDGSVILIIDPNGIAEAFGAGAEAEAETDRADQSKVAGAEAVAFLVFRAGGDNPKAVPLSLVTRLEEIDVTKIETANGRDLVQYRGSLMPLIYVNNQVKRRETGAQPMLVFADGGRTMGLVVDQIVDIVEDILSVEIASPTPGVVGTAVIKGKATEVLDIAYYLPLAFDDWFKRHEMKPEALTRRLLFVDDSAFFRNMLTPVLKAAGYEVNVYASAPEALDAAKKGGRIYDVIVSDIEMPEMNGFEFAEALKRDDTLRSVPIIALSSHSSPAAVERGRVAGFHDYVAKFDRQGLIAALKETAAQHSEAA